MAITLVIVMVLDDTPLKNVYITVYVWHNPT